jgi:hypothetical protein
VITVEDLDHAGAKAGPLTIDNIDLTGFLKLGTPALAYIGFTGGTVRRAPRRPSSTGACLDA